MFPKDSSEKRTVYLQNDSKCFYSRKLKSLKTYSKCTDVKWICIALPMKCYYLPFVNYCYCFNIFPKIAITTGDCRTSFLKGSQKALNKIITWNSLYVEILASQTITNWISFGFIKSVWERERELTLTNHSVINHLVNDFNRCYNFTINHALNIT